MRNTSNQKKNQICILLQSFNPSGAESRIFHENKISTVDADGLAPSVAIPSAAKVLTVKDKQVFAFY